MRILDSDHCVAILRGLLVLEEHVDPTEDLGVTAVSVGELVHGAAKSARAERYLAALDVLVAALTVLPFDERCAQRFGVLKARLERAGERLDDLDLQIAATVLAAGGRLVTHNSAHFERIAELGLEDWLS